MKIMLKLIKEFKLSLIKISRLSLILSDLVLKTKIWSRDRDQHGIDIETIVSINHQCLKWYGTRWDQQAVLTLELEPWGSSSDMNSISRPWFINWPRVNKTINIYTPSVLFCLFSILFLDVPNYCHVSKNKNY